MAALPRSVMNCRRLMGFPLGPRITPYHIVGRKPRCASQHFGPPDFRNGSKPEITAAHHWHPLHPDQQTLRERSRTTLRGSIHEFARSQFNREARASCASRCRLFLVRRDHQRGLAGSPTTTKGAHRRGSASTSDFAPSIIARIDCRNASAWDSFGSLAAARNVPIISLAVASSLTLQCETISDRAPA